MKTIHKHKLAAVLEMKWRGLFSKNFIIMPLTSIGITFVMLLLYQSIAKGQGHVLTDYLRAMALGVGATMNITMTGILCTAMSLAEEKEKHTLRALMTSSVNGLEFFLGSVVPVVFLMTLVNGLLILVSGLSLSRSSWAAWIGVSLLCAVASAVLGMVLGICTRDQMSASTFSTIPMLFLAVVPSFGAFNAGLKRISDFLFTGVLANTAHVLVEDSPVLPLPGLAVIIGEILLAAALFLWVYRRNGYDAGAA